LYFYVLTSSEFRAGGQREGETVEVGSLAAMSVEEGEMQCALTPSDSTELWRADIRQSENEFSIVELKPFADSPTVLIPNRRESLNLGMFILKCAKSRFA
jgi:hypothetical protein